MTKAAQAEPHLGPRLYAVLGLLVMLGPLATSLYVPGLPDLAASLDVTITQAELTVTGCLLGLALGQVFVGPVSDRWGRRRPILVGVAMYFVASVLCAIAPSWGFLLGARFVQGLAGAAGIVIARASVRDLSAGTAAAVALSRLLMVTGLAPVIGPLLGGQLLNVADWRVLFVTLSALSGVSLVIAALWFPETLPRNRRVSAGLTAQLRAMSSLLRDRDVLASMAVIGLLGGVTFSWMASGPFYFDIVFGMTAPVFAACIAVASVAFVLGAWVNTRVVRRIGVRTALVRGLLLVAVFSTGVLVTGLLDLPVWWVVASGVLAMGTYGGMGANAQSLALTPHGARAGAVAALLGMMQFVGGAVVPPVATMVAGEIWAMGVGMATAGVLALMVARLLTRQPVERDT